MVGPLLLFKMLHCRKNCQTSSSSSPKEEPSIPESSSERRRSKRLNRDYSSNTCRVCLKEGDIPIYGSEDADDIPEALLTFGGVQVEREDSYPKYLCQSCHALLQGAILFRKTAQESDQELKKTCKREIIEDTNDWCITGEDNSADDYNSGEEELKIFNCKRCDLQFPTFKEFCDHRLSEEHENKRITCKICNKSYTALYFKKHAALHKPDCTFMCDICGKKFTIQGQFARHRVTHFYKLPFKCAHCPYRGRFSESLKMHMRSHTGEKPYQCSECAARFVSKSNLNKHMYTHKADHDFKCENCGRGFYTKRTLELHIKVDHVGIKDHVCNICGKPFGYRKQMMKHQLKVHKRQKLKSGRMPLYLQVEKMEKMGVSVETQAEKQLEIKIFV